MTVLVEVTKRGEISLNKVKHRRERYIMDESDDGTLTLTPAAVILEPHFADANPEILRIIEQGILATQLGNTRAHTRNRKS